MAKTILVAVSPESRPERLLRHLEILVQPGDSLVFLSAYRGAVLDQLGAQVSLMHTGLEAAVVCEAQRELLRQDEQKARLEQNIGNPARRAFSPIGAQVETSLYSGSLRRAIKRYKKTGDLVLVPGSGSSWLDRLKLLAGTVCTWFGRGATLIRGTRFVATK